MKKLLSFVILFVLLITIATTVNATNSSELADKLYDMGKPYGMTSSDKIRIERYLTDNKVTDEQANQVISKAEQAVAIMEKAGTTNYSKLSNSQKEKMKSLAIDAAKVLDLTLEFSNKQLNIYQDGKLIDVVTYDNNGKLAYTGNSSNTILVVSSIAIIALAAVFVARKKLSNA